MIKNLTKQEFLETVFNYEKEEHWNYNGELPLIIDFYADWCAPCRALSLVLDEIDQIYEGKIQIYKVNTEVEQEMSADFGIRSIPSMLFCPIGETPQMANGGLPKVRIHELIESVLKVEL